MVVKGLNFVLHSWNHNCQLISNRVGCEAFVSGHLSCSLLSPQDLNTCCLAGIGCSENSCRMNTFNSHLLFLPHTPDLPSSKSAIPITETSVVDELSGFH